ncbi:MAG: hypothetical protein NZ891_03190, partial [bacterium]|nr:hypothetical protein [bacterium]MDW8163730.1 hypothetical protein [Candidatus Omnitrophota bacterium]
FQLFILKRYFKKLKKKYQREVEMVGWIITRIFWLASLIIKEFGLFVGLVEQIIKILAGIASLTPTRKDDVLVEEVKDLFNSWQEKIYKICEIIVRFYNTIYVKITK